MIKRKIILLLLTTAITITGCWNYSELNDLAFSLAIGFDEAGNQIKVTSQVIDPESLSGETATPDTPVTNFKSTGSGVQEALRRMTTKSTRKLNLGQLQVMVIGEKLAKEGLREVLDHVTRDHDYGKDFYIMVAKGTEAEEILGVLPPLEEVPASKMFSSLEVSSEAWGETTNVTLREFVRDVISNGKEAVLTGIEVEGKEREGMKTENKKQVNPLAQIKYSSLAVFKDDRLIGWLSEEESKGYNYIQGNIKSTTVSFPCSKKREHINVEVLGSEETNEFKLENGHPSMNVQLHVEGAITSVGCEKDLSNPKLLNQLEKDTEKNIKTEIEAAIDKAQSTYEADFLGFGEVIHRKNPTYWHKVQDDWNQHFATLSTNVEVNVNIKHPFRNNKSFLERMRN